MANGLWCAVRRYSSATRLCRVPLARVTGLWPMVRRKAVLGRYAALRCLWHDVRDDERSNR
eukprot:4457651-Prymnesium_polylepis.1